NTAIWGGPGDDHDAGAVWVFRRTNGAWTQQGSKLVGTGAVGAARQGASVSLSADATTAIAGGPCDDNHFPASGPCAGTTGAAWVYMRPPPPNLVASILPGSRSVQVGNLASAFAAIIN